MAAPPSTSTVSLSAVDVANGTTDMSGGNKVERDAPTAADQLGDQSSADFRQRGGVSGPLPAAEGRAALCTAYLGGSWFRLSKPWLGSHSYQ